MADSFFGFDTSLSNLNDDEGGGEPSEDEYDALNDETFGPDSEDFDWEVEHEHLAEQLESSRRQNALDEADTRLEASLCKLVLDETDAPQSRMIGSSVWRHDASIQPAAPVPPAPMKNVCTVEELERQLRQNPTQNQGQGQNQNQSQMPNSMYAAYFQPRFPVILQRPPGLQAPVPLPFAPQQNMGHNLSQMNQPNQLNKIIGQNTQMNQMGQPNQMPNHIGPNVNQMGQNPNQMGQNMNQINQNVNQLGQNVNQFMQNANQMNQFQNNQMNQGLMNQMPQNMGVHQLNQTNQLMPNQMASNQNLNQVSQNMNQIGQNMNQMGQNMNQMNPNINPIGPMNQNMNQLGQNVNQMGPNMNQMNQMGPNANQMTQNINKMGQNLFQMNKNMGQMNQMNQLNSNMNHMGQNMNQMNQKMNQMGQMNQNMNQMGQNVGQMNQMIPNGNQFGQGMNQFPHMMAQPRMMAPPPGMAMTRQNFTPNMNQFNPNFRGPSIPPKPNEQQPMPQQPMNQQPMNQQPMNQQPMNQQPMNQQPMNQQPMNQQPMNVQPMNQQPMNQQPMNQQPMNQPNLIMNQMKTQQANQVLNTNQPQKPIQKPTPCQTPNQNLSHKVQKTRIYSNKSIATPTPTNAMTSQGLVQIIQNTHPMLQFNNISGYHNANHHPMLNRNSLFNQFNNLPMFASRPNGTYNNVNRHSNGDDSSAGSDTDDYAGLMTQREKQWLINIQMLQLNTGTPYIHDFYYTVFLERQANKEKEGMKEAHKANQQNHPFYSSGVTKQESHVRERHNSHRHNSTGEDAPRTYVPTQFENSLGKLQCGSVTAPRKIIDVEVVAGEPPSGRASRAASVASTTNPAEAPREVKRTKQLLLDIEALYLVLLRLEELNDPLAIANALILMDREEKQKQLEAAQKEAAENEQEEDLNLFLRNIESVQRRKPDSPKSESIDKRQVVNLAVSQKPPPVKNLLNEDKEDLLNKMFLGLLHGDRLQQMLCVRKGKALVARFLRRVPGAHARLRALWSRVLRALPSAARRDDGALPALAEHYKRYIQNTTGWSAVIESCGLLSEALDPARTPYVLTSSFTLSCVCALFDRAMVLVNTPDATSNERQWYKFLKTLARALKCTTLTVAKPLEPLSEERLKIHMKQLDSRSTIEILQRGKSAVELSKSEVSELLVKHLC